jgi:hypothetical protein
VNGRWFVDETYVRVSGIANKGSGRREVGDGILWCDPDGAVLQIKARDHEVGQTDNEHQAESWIRKHVAKAVRQGRGTKRALSDAASKSPLVLRPIRSLQVPPPERHKFDRVAKSDPLTWPTVVILDHSAVPKIDLEPAADAIGVLTQPGATDYLFALVEDPDSVPPIPASVLDAVVAEFGELPVKAML